MTPIAPQGNHNTRITMAILGFKIDNLAEKIDDGAASQEKLWIAHLAIHADQETRLRYLETHSRAASPFAERVINLEKWQEAQKVRTGRFAVVQTAISAALAALSGWLASRMS